MRFYNFFPNILDLLWQVFTHWDIRILFPLAWLFIFAERDPLNQVILLALRKFQGLLYFGHGFLTLSFSFKPSISAFASCKCDSSFSIL